MIKYFLLFIIVVIFFIKFNNYEGFMECPETYNQKFNTLKKNYVEGARGYTPNDYIYITENVVDNLPIPVNMNFLNNKF